MRLLVLCGGPSSEYNVSIASAKNIIQNLDKNKYEVSVCVMDKYKNTSIYKSDEFLSKSEFNDFKYDLEASIKMIRSYDFVFISMHGEFGEDGTLQKILEDNSIKYQGCDSKSSKLCFDKTLTFEKVSSISGIKLPKTIGFYKDNYKKVLKDITFPAIIKPNALGSSVGVRKIENIYEFNDYIEKYINTSISNEKFLYQEFIKGIELSCGYLEAKDGKSIILPPVEIVTLEGKLFDYDQKYSSNGAKEICPPVSIDKITSDKVSNLSKEIHILLGCRTYSRSDFILRDNEIYYLETNTLPGMTSNSLLPKEAKAIGVSYSELLDFLILNSI